MGHVTAGLVAPRPEVVDAFLARGRNGRLELRDVPAIEAEARHPELRADPVALGRLAEEAGEAAHERAGRLAPVLPVRIRRQRPQSREGGDLVPVSESLRTFGRRQEADRVRAAARRDVIRDLAQEVDDGLLAEAPHLRRELAGDRATEALGAAVTAAGPARGVVDSDVLRHDPRRLVPEDRVDAAFEHPVGPLLAEVE